MPEQIELGKTYKDKVTGFAGVCTGTAFYISGCHQALLMPKVKADGSATEGQWFDFQRLEHQSNVETMVLDNGKTPGHDKAAPKR